jgi:uncharacterized protein (DUF2147 family)
MEESAVALRKFRNAFLTTALIGSLQHAANADPVGLWRSSDGGTTRIAPCGNALCGYVASMNPRLDPATGRPWADKNNTDESKRNRPLIGVSVLMSMRPDGPNRWTGQLYDIDRGKFFAGHLVDLDPNTVRIEGCVFGICGGEKMSRVREPSVRNQ